ncbi:FkbM family methyltransferase [Herbiconiux solani]|uniref:FkbM family methyltransferase n=1 Tax=Herbiconiux solani TaxID=661329 RepID=UPI0008270915|nr:FkbM family methyltransferase [Herbiconiux solani]
MRPRQTDTQPLPTFEPAGPIEPATWVRAHGIEVLVPSADQVVTPYMKRKREWDGTVLSAVLDSLSPTSSFLDVGAMVGYFSTVVAKKIPRGTVVAVEPLRANLELASLNLSNFDNTLLLEGAVTNSPELAWSVVPDDGNRGNTRVGVDRVAGSIAPHVTTATLHDLVRHFRSDVVKIDVQGMEKDVLGSLDVSGKLPRNLTLFCEITPSQWRDDREILAAIRQFQSAGFDAYFLTEANAYSTFTPARLERLVNVGSSWVDHFDMIITRGRYAATIRGRA